MLPNVHWWYMFPPSAARHPPTFLLSSKIDKNWESLILPRTADAEVYGLGDKFEVQTPNLQCIKKMGPLKVNNITVPMFMRLQVKQCCRERQTRRSQKSS